MAGDQRGGGGCGGGLSRKGGGGVVDRVVSKQLEQVRHWRPAGVVQLLNHEVLKYPISRTTLVRSQCLIGKYFQSGGGMKKK